MTAIDPHYFYQGAWAAKRILESGVREHLDVGSSTDFVSSLTAFTTVVFIDIRPLDVDLDGLTSLAGSVLELPCESRSIPSLSCLHVIEHVGLGRYGDPIDPKGTLKAIKELQRVVAPGGSLYLSLPVGRARTQFNAHRVSDPRQVVEQFDELDLVDFSITTDDARFVQNASVDGWESQLYACGMFHLRRPEN